MRYNAKKFNRVVKFLSAPVLAVSAWTASPAWADEIASIDGLIITEQDFRDAIKYLGPSASVVASNPEMRARFLDHLVENQLLSSKALTEKIADTPEYKAREAHARREILATMYAESYVRSKSTEADLETYFKKNKHLFVSDEVKVRHILVRDETEAKKTVEEALKPGTDFATLAKKFSSGPTKDRGGDLGWIGKGRMTPEFEKAAFSLKKGEVYPKPVRTQFGFHVIKVEDIRNGDTIELKEVRKEVEQALATDLRKELVNELRKNAKIKIDSNAIKAMKF